jgi:predicted dehydrogenase
MVGFGFMGKTHLYAVRNLPFFYGDNLPFTAEVAAVCTARLETAKAAALEFGIPRFCTEEEMLSDPTVDVIDICSPNPYHYDTICKALTAGKHVLCEKPLTVTADEADQVTALASESGLVCGMVFNNRFLSPVMRAKQLMDEGRLGRILSFDFSYLHNSCIDPERRVGWKQTAASGGGTLADLGPHVIDLCHHLCGKMDWVSGRSQIAFPTHLTKDGQEWQTDADEAFYLLCGTEDGACGRITVSKLTQGANDELSFTINGTAGSLRFDLMEPNWLYFYDANAAGSPLGGERGWVRIECVGRYPAPASGFPSPKAPVGWLRGHVGNMMNYLSAVADGSAVSPSFGDGAYVARFMEAARLSDTNEGKRITL